MSDTWTIGELAERAARALRGGGSPVNGRVRDVPGERLIRWYTTIGLVDPPLTRRGRIAQYGRRHLLQLVAVKRLQAAGHSIAQIQAALAGATDRMLEATAGLAPTSGADATPRLGAAPHLESAPGLEGSSGLNDVAGPGRTARPDDATSPDAAARPDTTSRPDGATRPDGADRLEDALLSEPPLRHGPTPTGRARLATDTTYDGPGRGADATHDDPGCDTRATHDGPGRATRATHDGAGPAAGARVDDAGAATGIGAERDGVTTERSAAERGVMRSDDDAAQARTGTTHTRDGVARADGESARERFWADRPGKAATRAAGTAGQGATHDEPGVPRTVAPMVTGVRLADGVRLVLDAGRVPSEEDVQAVLAAAAPLIAVLKERELTSTITD
ncbi:MerR family transcriptional regulator [Nonomuraea sp. B19D2]|uniref:MerR family transcriptional regulator n=1 Tax=Nonomuraea sp. B19D2 TaxID=3159561 RepID=UPI0032DA1E73